MRLFLLSMLGVVGGLRESPAAAPLLERLAIRTDPRVELLSILQLLSGAEPYRRAAPSPYTRAVAKHFSPFGEHRAVEMTKSLRAALGIGYDAPMSLAIWIEEESFDARQALTPRPPGLDKRWSAAPIDEYLKAVRQFATDTEFVAFFESQSEYRTAVEQRYRAALDGVDPIAWFDDFFGPRPHASFRLVPGLLCGPNNYGTRAALADGVEVIWQVLGLGTCDESGLPILGEGLEALLVHELAHSYVNPAMEIARDAIQGAFESAHGIDPEVMRRQAYGSWFITACESIVRATTVIYLHERRGESRCVTQLGSEETRGFLWTEALATTLRGLRTARSEGRELVDFAPDLAEAVERWIAEGGAEREPPFRGPINAVFRWKEAGRMQVIAPRRIEGDAARDRCITNLERFHAQLYAPASVPLLEPGAPKSTLRPGVAQVIYGTPEKDEAVQALFEAAGWSEQAGSLHLGERRFEVENWVLIAAFPSPLADGSSVPTLLYTAHDAEDLNALNNLRHGTTDWIVGLALGNGRFRSVASGSFPKKLDGSWTLALRSDG